MYIYMYNKNNSICKNGDDNSEGIGIQQDYEGRRLTRASNLSKGSPPSTTRTGFGQIILITEGRALDWGVAKGYQPPGQYKCYVAFDVFNGSQLPIFRRLQMLPGSSICSRPLMLHSVE